MNLIRFLADTVLINASLKLAARLNQRDSCKAIGAPWSSVDMWGHSNACQMGSPAHCMLA